MTDLCVSDIHLSPAEPATAQRFLTFLAGPARDAIRLFVLGDLFDAWAGDDDLADPFNARIVTALRAVADSGVQLFFISGNRDFLVGADFARAAGIELLPEPHCCEIAGVPTLLLHGDTLCTDDADYQRFRATVRAPQWRRDFLARPLAERKREIESLRARSAAEKQLKSPEIMDVNADAVAALLREHDAQALIHGHTHRQGRYTLTVAGRPCTRWALGDWHPERGSALACRGSDWRFA